MRLTKTHIAGKEQDNVDDHLINKFLNRNPLRMCPTGLIICRQSGEANETF